MKNNKKQSASLLLLLLGSGILAAPASAQVILAPGESHSIHSNENNGVLGRTFSNTGRNPSVPTDNYTYASTSNGVISVSGTGSIGSRRLSSGIFYFELPDLGDGLSVGNASLAFTFSSIAGTGSGPGNLDLWGLGYNSSPSIAAADRANFWHVGDSDDRAGMGISSVIKIQDNMISNDAIPEGGDRLSTDADASDTLEVYLNSLYAAGATAGDYAVFRLSYDVMNDPNLEGFLGYRVVGSMAEATDDWTEADYPTLSLTAIPEPSTYALGVGILALGAAWMWRRRRVA